MKRLLIAGVLAAGAFSGASAGINGADAAGYYDRGVAMYHDKNFDGCIDQFLRMNRLGATPAQAEEGHYYIAMSTLFVGDDEALDLLEAYLAKYPESTRCEDVKCSIGDYYFTRGLYGDALKAYSAVDADALTVDRRDEMLYRTAYSDMLLGLNREASAAFASIATSPEYGNAARFYMAYIAYSEHRYSEARELFRQVDTSRDPGTAAEYYLSQIYFAEGDWQKALDAGSRALRSGAVPQFAPELKRVCGESLYNLGRAEDAIPYLKSYVAETPDARPSAYYMLGVCEYDAARYAEAIPLLQKATAQEGTMGQSAWLYLGQCYVKQGDSNGALMAFDNATKIDADKRITEVARYNYIAARMDGGRLPFVNSVGMLEDFLKKYPDSPYNDNVRESLVTGYMTDDDYESALRVIEGIRNPTESMLQAGQRAHFLYGTRLYHNDVEAALRQFDLGAAARGGKPDVTRQCRLWAANCRYDTGDYSEAAAGYLEFLRTAPADDPNRNMAYYNLGYTRMAQERYDDAAVNFRKVSGNPSVNATMKADALNREADALYMQRQYADAENIYRRAFETDEAAGDYAMYQMAIMRGLERDFKGSITMLDNMMERFPGSTLAPDALMAKAEAYTSLGQPVKAMDTYKDMIDIYPSTAHGRKARLQLALAQIEAGRHEEAETTYQELIRLYPTSDEARTAINDLKGIYADEGRLPEFVSFMSSVPDAPQVEISELETLAFSKAEEEYYADHSTRLLDQYLKQYPRGANVPDALYFVAEAAAEADEHPKAELFAARLVNEYPHAPQTADALLIKANAERAQGKGEIALNTYKSLEAIASTPRQHRDARMGIMLTAIDLGRYDDVLVSTERLLSSTADVVPERRQVIFYRALALNETGDRDGAAREWEELASDPSDIYGSKSAVYLAQNLLDRGMADKARKVADAFIDAGSPSNYWYARGFIVLSDILRAQGNDFEADAYLKSLKSNYPGEEADIFTMIDERLK